MRIGVFMGTFDPMHIGHESVIMDVINRGLVDSVMVVPTRRNPWKGEPEASYPDRYKMCSEGVDNINKACLGGKFSGLVYVSSIEADMTGPAYSSDVLREIRKTFPDDEVSIICGTDVARHIGEWHDGQWILDNCGIMEVGRVGEAGVDADYGMKLSSTSVREILHKGLNPYPFVSGSVYSYIKKNNLYKSIEQ